MSITSKTFARELKENLRDEVQAIGFKYANH